MNLPSLFLLVIGHCVADTALQSAAMARGKSRHNPIDMGRVPKGQKPLNLWLHWLTHHALIHGGMVYLVTSRVDLALAETVLHWTIDFFKCENKFNPHVDQLLHIACKVVYAL